MKRRKRPFGRISDPSLERGSIVLEACIVLPIILFILMFLIFMIRISVVQMALQDTVSQSVRQAAAHLHPAELLMKQLDEPANNAAAAISQPVVAVGVSDVLAELGEWLPDPAGPVLKAVGTGDWQPLVDMAATELGRGLAEPLLRKFAAESVLDEERIELARLSLPDLRQKQHPYLKLSAKYELPLRLPFTQTSITLQASAMERVWVSDALAAPQAAESSERAAWIQIISIEPNPLRPGRKARLIALTDPHRPVSLSVEYKSGSSKAKHLGEAAADEQGLVQWEWLVSGNTTSGLWELFVTAEDGTRVGMHFTVQRKGEDNN